MTHSVRRAFHGLLTATVLAPLLAGSAPADVSPSNTLVRGVAPEVSQAGRDAVRRGLDWLAKTQRANGSWSNEKYPALTALPLWAFARSDRPRHTPLEARAVAFVTSFAREDGGIYHSSLLTGGLSTYNTAVCMAALHALGDPALTPAVLKARTFLAGSQRLGDDVYSGGFGYSRNTFVIHADLQNTAFAIQAMRLTSDVEDQRPAGEPRADIDWRKAVSFIERLQNGPDTGPEFAGGMTYKPGSSAAGSGETPRGTVALRSSGSMTYAGLLSLVYADLSPDDDRVRSALEWASRHWTLDENPGVGDGGHYFFLNVMSRALNAAGRDTIPRDGGGLLWRSAYIAKVVALQKTDDGGQTGYWVNDKSNRFWEGDAVLVTSYCILGLQDALGRE